MSRNLESINWEHKEQLVLRQSPRSIVKEAMPHVEQSEKSFYVIFKKKRENFLCHLFYFFMPYCKMLTHGVTGRLENGLPM